MEQRLETERRLREQAERERDELAANLEALTQRQEPRRRPPRSLLEQHWYKGGGTGDGILTPLMVA